MSQRGLGTALAGNKHVKIMCAEPRAVLGAPVQTLSISVSPSKDPLGCTASSLPVQRLEEGGLSSQIPLQSAQLLCFSHCLTWLHVTNLQVGKAQGSLFPILLPDQSKGGKETKEPDTCAVHKTNPALGFKAWCSLNVIPPPFPHQ